MTDPKPVPMQSREEVIAEMKKTGTYAEPVGGEPIMGIGGTLGHTYAKPEQLTRQALFGVSDRERDVLAAQGIRLPADHNERLAAEDAKIQAKSAAELEQAPAGPEADDKKPVVMQSREQVVAGMRATGKYAEPVAGEPIMGIGGMLGHTYARPEQLTRQALFGISDAERDVLAAQGIRVSPDHNARLAAQDAKNGDTRGLGLNNKAESVTSEQNSQAPQARKAAPTVTDDDRKQMEAKSVRLASGIIERLASAFFKKPSNGPKQP